LANERALEEARRLERQLVVLRWVVAAFGALQVGYAIRDHARDPAFVLPLGSALVIGLTVGNLLIARAVDDASDLRRFRTLAPIAFSLDTMVVLGIVWVGSSGRADPLWVLGYLLPLEGAARWGLPGALLGASLFGVAEVAREVEVVTRRPLGGVGVPVLAFRIGMAYVVGAVAGSFASSLRTQAALADQRAREIEAAAAREAEAAERERQARGEVAALHAALLGEPDAEGLDDSLQATASAIALELGCEALAILVRERGVAGEIAFVARGVHGDPGYLHHERLSPLTHPVAAAAMEGGPVLAPPDAVAPMRVEGEVVGAIHEYSEGAALDPARLAALSRLADQFGVVLESTRLRADQEETVRRLRELDEMKTDFVAITSHELRTPLSGIRGFVEMLRRRGDDLSDGEREEFLDIVLTQTDRLVRLVDDLLVVSRVEAGRLTLEPEEVDLPVFLDRAVRALGSGSERVSLQPGSGVPDQVVLDPRRLAQVVTNLVHNALKVSPDSSTVTLGWNTEAEGTITFSVQDQGGGIAPDDLARIFDRFHQTTGSMSHTEGFGLGLYITKLLTEAMGGWIDVRSTLGEGSTFLVTLPTERTSPHPAPAAARTSTA
jgi:signal transduction histidine kinase